MKIQFAPLFLGLAMIACSPNEKPTDSSTQTSKGQPPKEEAKKVEAPSVEFSFTFVGCNRVDRGDQDNTAATNASSANLSALKRIFTEVTSEDRKPELFFFLGDLVYAESTLELLNSQLDAWVKQYNDPTFSSMASSGIELVAIPGNHEMLSWADHNVPNHDEWPLKGSTEIWMKYMAPFMPADREKIAGETEEVNQMTFAFTRKNVGFVVMNTDTYNPPTDENPWGLEGQIPMDWIVSKVQQYQKDPAIEHIFVLGHKPCYVNGIIETGHHGLPDGPTLWPALKEAHTNAMLSAHVHDYQRMQPGGEGTYQIIAGNAGSSGSATFFGYSTINILSNGEVELVSKGFDIGNPYYQDVPGNPFTVRDQSILTWTANANPYTNN